MIAKTFYLAEDLHSYNVPFFHDLFSRPCRPDLPEPSRSRFPPVELAFPQAEPMLNMVGPLPTPCADAQVPRVLKQAPLTFRPHNPQLSPLLRNSSTDGNSLLRGITRGRHSRWWRWWR
jgi:hypothetical protein